MSAEMATSTIVDSRESERIKLQGAVEYRTALDEPGVGQWQNVSNGGACLELGRYLRPGRSIALLANVRRIHDEPAEITAKVAWCRPTSDGETFIVGVQFRGLDVESRFAISTLIREAFKNRLYRDCATCAYVPVCDWQHD